MTNIQGVVFDWGGVIIDEPSSDLQNYCSTKLGIDPEKGGAAIWQFLHLYQEKKLSERQMWEKVCDACGKSRDGIPVSSLWSEALRAVFTFRDEVVNAIFALRQSGYKTGFLSNTEPEAAAFFHERKMGDWFDGAVLSCEVGISKPHMKIYHLMGESMQLPLERLLFIDDRQENIDGARAAGMHAVRVAEAKDVLAALHSFGLV